MIRRLSGLLAVAGALLLVPASQAFANGTLRVHLGGTGKGEVSSVGGFEGSGAYEGSPPIECKGPPETGTCETELVEEEFEPGLETIALHAVAAPGSTFVEWEIEQGEALAPGYCETNPECVMVNFAEPGGDQEAIALFEATAPPEFPLEITVEGSGEGEVSCEVEAGPVEPCEAEYEEGTEVTLVPEAEAGSEFSGWSGDCTGAGACELTMTEAKEVTAIFDLEPEPEEFALSVSKGGTGQGTVSSSPAGISCGASCSAEFEEGTEVTLSASPASGSSFAGWSGACTGAGACKVTMSEAKAVTATFAANPAPTPMPTPTPTPEPAREGKAKAAPSALVKAGRAAVKLTCTGGPCKGTLKLTAKLEVGGKTKSLVIGKASFGIAEGTAKTLKVRLTAAAKQALAKGPLRTRAGGVGVVVSTVKLKPAKKA